MMGDAYINGITKLKVYGDNKIIIGFLSNSLNVQASKFINYVSVAHLVS